MVNNNISIIESGAGSALTMRQQSKKSTRDPIILSLKKLSQNIQKSQQKNLQKHSKIKQLNPDFEFKLYKPSIPSYESREEMGLAEEIMLRQIDRLMEDQERLDLELDRNWVKVREHERKIQKQIMMNMDHFTFLRKLWKKDQAKQPTDAKVDKLIHNVGAIKGHILNLIKKQTQITESPPQIHNLILSSPQYCLLQKQHEQLKQQLQQKQKSTPQKQSNTTSQSSIEGQDFRKQTEQMEAEIVSLKLELLNRTNQVERLRRENLGIRAGRDGRDNTDGRDGRGIGEIGNYRVTAFDGSYQIMISETRNGVEESSNGSQKTIEQKKPIQCRHTLQQILKYLQNAQTRRSTRQSLTKTKPSEPQARSRKYTVQQITRPKFISTRLKTVITNDTSQS